MDLNPPRSAPALQSECPHEGSIGAQLRRWREHRRLSQLALALDADISARHLSFVENGRAQPSRDLIVKLAEALAVPLRERNALLLAGGFAPLYPERPLQHAALQPARDAIALVLAGHEPYPAIAIDRHWTLVDANRAAQRLLVGVDPRLLQPPVNVLRLSLDPQGLAPRIGNFGAWRAHLFVRLRQQITASADPALVALLDELQALPDGEQNAHTDEDQRANAAIAVPLSLRTPLGTLNFISTTTIFGTPVDVTLAEIAIESFFPADPATAAALRRLAPPDGDA